MRVTYNGYDGSRVETRQTLAELQRMLLGEIDPHAIVVTPNTALRCSPVHESVRILAESVSQLPLHLYRRDGDSRERADNHPLEIVLSDIASPGRPSYAFRLQAMVDLCLWGNAYAVIIRNSRRQVIELHRVRPDSVTVKLNEDTLAPIYEVSQKNTPARQYAAGDIIHLHWLSTDGLTGESPVDLAKDEIKLVLGIQAYAARLFQNGGRPAGYLRGKATDKSKEKIKKNFIDVLTGRNGPDDVPILGEFDFVKVGLNAVETELQALAKQTTRNILAIYRIPPPVAGDLEKANYSNAEFSGRTFLQHSLMPFLKQWESEIRCKCLTPVERKTLYAEFLVDDIVRADIAARFEAYSKAVTNGILCPNEVRAMENRPGYDGGNQFRVPMNTENPNAGAKPNA